MALYPLRILTALAVAVLSAPGAAAKQVCVEELSGVCLKFKTVPDAKAKAPSRAERAERALGLNREDRRAVQRGLSAERHYQGGIDGAIGPGTRRAIRAWQRAEGLPVTGFLDADSYAALTALAPSRAAPEAAGTLPAYVAICSKDRKTRNYTVHQSDQSIADAFRKARRAGAQCGFPLAAAHGDCVALAGGPDGEWSLSRRFSEAEAVSAAMRLCKSREGNDCALEALHCSRPGARPVGSAAMRRESARFAHYCGVGGRPGEYRVALSQRSANDARNMAEAEFGLCPYSISLTRGVCVAIVSSTRGAFHVSRKGSEREARNVALSKCEGYDRGPCRVNELICFR